MAKEEILCDNCNQPMKLVVKLSNHKTKVGSYRRRRFKCDLCDITKMVFGDGERDNKLADYDTMTQIEKMYKEQESNNDK